MIQHIRYHDTHVHRTRAQPELPARRPAARVLPQGRQGLQAHPRQPLEVARRDRPGAAHPAQGRRRPEVDGRRLRDPALPTPRACRRRRGHGAEAGPREAARPPSLADALLGGGDDRRPRPRPPLEARHRPGPRLRDADRHAGRGARRRRRDGGGALRGDGLAAAAAAAHRADSGGPARRGRLARALRSDLGVLRGHEVPAGQARLLPRRQARQASDRLRPALRPGGPSGGRPGLRGQHGRPRLRGRPGREAHRALLALAGRRGRRPGDADRRPHPRGPRARGAAVDHLAAGSGDPQARFRRRPAAVDLRRAGPGRGLRARALSGRAAGRLPQPAARGRARAQAKRRCSRPRRSSSNRSSGRRSATTARCGARSASPCAPTGPCAPARSASTSRPP